MADKQEFEENLSALHGLTAAEVDSRKEQGKTNYVEDTSSRSVKQIIIDNVCTYFNFIFAVIAVLLIIAGSWSPVTFLPVIANLLIGIGQQIYAKNVLDKLSLLNVTKYTALRDGVKEEISSNDLVQDDVILLASGQQVPADGQLLQGEVSVNESLLTGEQDEIAKKQGDQLRSGSFVVSGRGWIVLQQVGSAS